VRPALQARVPILVEPLHSPPARRREERRVQRSSSA
jgi:hypothetical protein